MSNACDPRNRPGYVSGDATPFIEPLPVGSAVAADGMRTVLYAWVSALLIVAAVVSMVLISQ